MIVAILWMSAAQPGPPHLPIESLPGGVIEIVQSFLMTVAVIALGVPIIRTISRRWERGGTQTTTLPADVTNRLERIEQAVEAVAIEVERIAESQRFTAKLMAERALPPGERPAPGGTASVAESAPRPDVRR